MKVLIAHIWKGAYHIYKPEIEMVLGLRSLGVEIHLVGDSEAKILKEFKEKGFVVHHIDFKRKIEPKKIKALRKLVQKERFDIVHAIYNKYVANAVQAVKKLPVKLIAYRGATINWHDPMNYLTFLHPRIDSLICVCDSVEENVKHNLKFWKTPTTRIYKGHNLAWYQDVSTFNFQEINLPEDAFVVTLASSVRKVKGVEYFLRAANYLPSHLPIYLLLAGDNTDGEEMQKLRSQTNNQEKIILLGYRPDILSIIKSSDVFVLPTIGVEGLSRSVIEAMSLKTPVVATKCGGPEEIIEQNETGLLIEKKQPKAIADAILHLYKNPQLRLKFAENGEKRIEQNFHVKQTVRDTFTLYKTILS